MLRACKLSLKFLTPRKRRAIETLLESYQSAINFYTRSLWTTPGKLDKDTLARLSKTRLSARYKSQALKQALEIVIATKLSLKALKKRGSCPKFNGSAILDAKFVTIEEGKHTFDLAIKLSSLAKGKRITILSKRTKVLNKWLSFPGAKLKQGCSLSKSSLVVWVDIPDTPHRTEGVNLGVDIGMHKLLSSSDGLHYGREFKELKTKILRKKRGSKAMKRTLDERDNYIRRVVNELPWDTLKLIGFEDLTNIKKGKSKKRGKNFRKASAPWVPRQVIAAIIQKAQENRVYPVQVNPAYTSQTCPSCEAVLASNRKGENYKCNICGYHNDADTVGAINILNKALRLVGRVESSMPSKDIIINII